MLDLFGAPDNPYRSVYESLSEVRELFHREGRIGDANAKLDETVKFLAIHFAATKGLIDAAKYEQMRDERRFSVSKLQELFRQVATIKSFIDEGGSSIFGARPHIAFEQGDEKIAFQLFVASGRAFSAQHDGTHSFDVLNEAFGHHVRDNFRSHIEDAQYMTPPEVIDFMVALAAYELKGQRLDSQKRFTMIDPSCGVGSFISTWRSAYNKMRERDKKLPPLAAVGQDKIDRMARLSMMNLIFSGKREEKISCGNSLVDGSALDKYSGTVDLILTNPPFGAKFPINEVRRHGKLCTPIFATGSLSAPTIDSELLFIDRYLSLLREGGRCLAIVPDGVISAKGTPAFLRQRLSSSAVLKAVIELPPVTFAQAGTRTKTAVLYFEKNSSGSSGKVPVFFGEVDDLGFEVSKRKGVPIKRSFGINQLPDVLSAFEKGKDSATDQQGQPITAVWREIDPARQESWTPRQFKFDNKNVRKKANGKAHSLVSLGDLVEPPIRRRLEKYTSETFFISILHVIGEGMLDVVGVKNYQPISPGISVLPGEVIISRLNPRIPRVLAVPDLGRPLLCSNEFEILRPRTGVSPYALAYMLMSPLVQEQINSLTAGTSASHSRVKADKLYEVQIPWPQQSNKLDDFEKITVQYTNAAKGLIQAICEISDLREAERNLMKAD